VPPIDGPLGSLCRTYLRGDVPRLVIEVDAQQGAALPEGVLAHLSDALAAVVDKPGGVVVQDGGGVPGGAQPWTLDAVRSLAAATRDVPHGGDTAVMHVLSLRGEPDQAEPAPGTTDIRASIGIAFDAGEFVVFPDRVDSLAALLGGVEAVLRAVTVHEAGHLLCLVGISYDSELDHEDPEHPGHSRDRGSVMFHAIETTAIGQLFSGPPPSAFAAADLADLDGLRSGRY
jgi:hypothetical protein